MNISENELESILRNAPAPRPPQSLADQLLNDFPAQSRSGSDPSRNHQPHPHPQAQAMNRPRPRNWWPLALPAIVIAAFATVLVVQQTELNRLQDQVQTLQQSSAIQPEPVPPAATPSNATPTSERQDLERLRTTVSALGSEVDALEQVRAGNEALRSAVQAYQAQLPKDLQEASALQDRAAAIRCVNNLKQLGLAVRVYATDNSDEFPPDVLSITNELGTPKVLICPADDVRQPAPDWASFTPANCSYELLSPGPGQFEREPLRLLWRCPIHGSVTLCDGSVQMAVAKDHPERIEFRNGAQYLIPDRPAASVAATDPDPATEEDTPNSGAAPVDAEVAARIEKAQQAADTLAKRYGLAPGSFKAAIPYDPAVANRVPHTIQTVTNDGVVTTNLILPPPTSTPPQP